MKKRKKKKLQRIEFQRDLALEFIKSEKGRPVFTWIFQIAVVLALAAVVSIFFFQSIVMQESSMEPTIETGERFFVNRLVYKFTSPNRGDIIAFTKDGSDDAPVHIKRVIGLPGETIEIRDGVVYINGEEYEEEGDLPKITNPGLAENGVTLENDEYFVLGDNRNNSEDSRFAEVQNVNEKYIEGKVWFCVYPADKIGFVKR
ncbi:MAG TPA: signal peptidase I [Candidatus Blautia merdigallinarum]|uniref:Signal peptidase I n=1 Tax=Candidatus Blautia merdigallinarum TaxID=2838495 RepID=A0A9D2N5C1_9FIRM|nr:signal peptidase I [Candidatus Blautia merdigallinarum]